MQVLREEVVKLEKWIGAPVKRIEDKRLILGGGRYLDDIDLPNTLHTSFIRSPVPHAEIKSIDISKAVRKDWIRYILLGDEVKRLSKPLPLLWFFPEIRVPSHYALALNEVNHVGEAVVAIAASDRYLAEDATELIEIEYNELPAIIDPEKALIDSTNRVHDEFPDNKVYHLHLSNGNPEEIEKAHLLLRERFRIQRMAGCPIEPRGAFASYDPTSGNLTLWSSTQFPHVLRTCISGVLGIAEHKIRVIAPDVGGGFGVKGEVFPEEVVVCLLAIKTGRPVKWVSTRREDFLSTTHARDVIIDVTAGFERNGRLVGVKAHILADFGAYLHVFTPGGPFITALSLNGPYKYTHFDVEIDAVFTNKVPLSAYRGFGQPEAAFVMERVMDIAANELGLDRAEIRFRNFIQPDEFPYRTITGGLLDSGNYPACLREALRIANYEQLKEKRLAAAGTSRPLGIGIACYTEVSGFAPSRIFHHDGLEMGGYESSSVRIDPSGKVCVMTGASPHGQGLATCLAQICADIIGVDINDVEVLHGDTAITPYGHGTFGSRSLVTAGTATVIAANEVRRKMLRIAAHLLKSNVDDLEITEGRVFSRSSGESIPIKEVAMVAYRAFDLPEGEQPGLEYTYYYDPKGLTISYGVHICVVELDLETGNFKIPKYVVIHDAGKVVNPLIVEGQLHGGVVAGLSQAFLEEIIYDEAGNLLTTTFMDYLLPTSMESPGIELGHFETPSPLNPLGVKGVGEGGTIIAPAALINAISDALGVKINNTPATPEKIYKIARK